MPVRIRAKKENSKFRMQVRLLGTLAARCLTYIYFFDDFSFSFFFSSFFINKLVQNSVWTSFEFFLADCVRIALNSKNGMVVESYLIFLDGTPNTVSIIFS